MIVSALARKKHLTNVPNSSLYAPAQRTLGPDLYPASYFNLPPQPTCGQVGKAPFNSPSIQRLINSDYLER